MYNLFKRTPFEHFGTFNSMELELVVACMGVSFGNIDRFFEYMLLITLHLSHYIFLSLWLSKIYTSCFKPFKLNIELCLVFITEQETP